MRTRLGPAIAALLLAAVLALPAHHYLLDRSGTAHRPHVVMIVIDTLRADVVDLSEGSRISPFLERFSRNAIVYHAARANAPWTLPSHASIFTGLLPSRHGATWKSRRLADHHVTLAEMLGRHGYLAVGFSENPWIGRMSNVIQGFTQFVPVNLYAGARVSDAPLLGSLRRWADSHTAPSPVFLFVNIVDPHAPYGDGKAPASVSQAPEDYLCRVRPPWKDDIAELHELYRADVRRADDKVRLIYDTIAGAIPLREALVIITSDHGEHFGEHDLVSHQFSVYDDLLRVPLLVRLPGQAERRDILTPVSLVDVYTSVLTLIGIPHAMGDAREIFQQPPTKRTLLAEYSAPRLDVTIDNRLQKALLMKTHRMRKHCDQRSDFFADLVAVSDGDYKLIRSSYGSVRLYDLRSDPQERTDIASLLPEIVRKLLRRLEKTKTPPITLGR